MLFTIFLALIVIGVGYFIQQKFSVAAGTQEKTLPNASGSKREKAVSKRENLLASNRSVYNTAANGTSTRNVAATTTEDAPTILETAPITAPEVKSYAEVASAPMEPKIAPEVVKSYAEVAQAPPSEGSSRDVKTARSPTRDEELDTNNNYTSKSAAAPTLIDGNNNNNVQLVRDVAVADSGAPAVSGIRSEEGKAGSPTATTAVRPTPSEIVRGNLANLPDATAHNVSPLPGGESKREIKADPATESALNEDKSSKKKDKKRGTGSGKKKSSKPKKS